MKYMLLIYGNDELWSSFEPAVMAEVVRETDASHAALVQSGEFVGAYGVGHNAVVKTVTRKDGPTIVSDGPYLETKEHLGSFTIVDVESAERAYEIAALNPFARFGQVEVRPLLHEADPHVG
ncbi:MAG: YCII-related protein [Actinomycetia bacterium]|nr:YCII-related protein [Actinomycetes bacterium]